jgi:hypothetical protein
MTTFSGATHGGQAARFGYGRVPGASIGRLAATAPGARSKAKSTPGGVGGAALRRRGGSAGHCPRSVGWHRAAAVSCTATATCLRRRASRRARPRSRRRPRDAALGEVRARPPAHEGAWVPCDSGVGSGSVGRTRVDRRTERTRAPPACEASRRSVARRSPSGRSGAARAPSWSPSRCSSSGRAASRRWVSSRPCGRRRRPCSVRGWRPSPTGCGRERVLVGVGLVRPRPRGRRGLDRRRRPDLPRLRPGRHGHDRARVVPARALRPAARAEHLAAAVDPRERCPPCSTRGRHWPGPPPRRS